MNAKEFIIKNFETNYPELVQVVEKWSEHSIKQNWGEVRIILNSNNVKNCPGELEYGPINEKKEQGNLRHYYLLKISQRVAEYLNAQGFSFVETWMTGTLLSPEGNHQSGFLLKAKYQ